MILRRRLLTENKPLLMNVAMCYLTTGELFQTPNPTLFSSELYEPIGIVVIPTEHDVYGTGECGIMALKSANARTPDEGSTLVYTFGTNDRPIITTNDYVFNIVGNNGQIFNDVQSTGITDCYLPYDYDPGYYIPNKYDPDTYYYKYNDRNVNYLPSPFIKDGFRNELYYSSYYSTINAFSDFNGKENTLILCNKDDDFPNWKTDETLTYVYGNNTTCSRSCWRYHTTGTNLGDWYLPALGELGYISVRESTINKKLQSLLNYCPLQTGKAYSSSTSIKTSNYGIDFGCGQITTSNQGYVRPFTRKILPVRFKP